MLFLLFLSFLIYISYGNSICFRQNDYSRDYSRLEETILLAPLLERLDDLIKEFKGKLGPEIGADGVRRAAVVMVANEGVMDLLLVSD